MIKRAGPAEFGFAHSDRLRFLRKASLTQTGFYQTYNNPDPILWYPETKTMRNLYVYILECVDNTYYVGVTNNVGRRFIEHTSGLHEDSFTYKKRPLKLVYCREFKKPMDAINFEKQLKGWTRAKKEALIKGNFNELHELAKCNNQTSHMNYHIRSGEFSGNQSLKKSRTE